MKEYIALIHRLADTSGEVIRSYYRSKLDIEHKEDASPVTEADRAAEQAMRTLIMQAFPEHGINGEEFGVHQPGSEYTWHLDPIDGTVSFTVGRPIFGTLIALSRGSEALLGVIDQPIVGDRWIGGAGVAPRLNGKEISASYCTSLKEAVIATTGPNYFSPGEWELFQRIGKEVRRVVYGGDCYNYGLLAMGSVDAVIESGLKTHDVAALIPVIEAAGGIITDWHGQPLLLNSETYRVVAASTPELHTFILKML